jgi:hypothetical protein
MAADMLLRSTDDTGCSMMPSTRACTVTWYSCPMDALLKSFGSVRTARSQIVLSMNSFSRAMPSIVMLHSALQISCGLAFSANSFTCEGGAGERGAKRV